MTIEQRLIEPEVVAMLRLDVTKKGGKRKHTHRAIYKLIHKGQRVNGKRVKLRAESVGGVLLFPVSAVAKFLEAVVVR